MLFRRRVGHRLIYKMFSTQSFNCFPRCHWFDSPWCSLVQICQSKIRCGVCFGIPPQCQRHGPFYGQSFDSRSHWPGNHSQSSSESEFLYLFQLKTALQLSFFSLRPSFSVETAVQKWSPGMIVHNLSIVSFYFFGLKMEFKRCGEPFPLLETGTLQFWICLPIFEVHRLIYWTCNGTWNLHTRLQFSHF